MYHRIPEELQRLNQWVVWRYEETLEGKPTKVPYNPRSGALASTTNSETWSSFDICVAAVAADVGYSGIGFVFTETDPYCGIDCDATDDETARQRQWKVFQHFHSYSELSPSGQGLHIIIKGRLPGSGRRRSHIEVYDKGRFFTFTGNVYLDAPIAERQELVELLYSEMGKANGAIASIHDAPEIKTDLEVYEQAASAANGEKFLALWNGDWQSLGYPSQSEADFALIDIVAFYTQNREQITRLFRQSALGQRKKAERTGYLNYMLNRAFDRMLPPIDIVGLEEAIANAHKETAAAQWTAAAVPGGYEIATALRSGATEATVPQEPPRGKPYDDLPPGLVGDIARFIYAQAPRPVKEYAIAGALAFMAGVCGRAYNTPTGTGLNLYIMALGKSGTGKEAMRQGIDKIIAALQTTVPALEHFRGPGDIASGQAIIKHLSRTDRHPSCISIIGEARYKLEAWSSKYANAAQHLILSMLLDLYNKSGATDTLSPTIYSTTEKNIPPIRSPAFSVLCESTATGIYNILDENMIATGLLPRFSIIEYEGDLVEENTAAYRVQPPQELLDRVAKLAVSALSINKSAAPVPVAMNDGATALFDSFRRYVDSRIIGSEEHLRELWNRAVLKALKIASLVAVGYQPFQPTITEDMANWAMYLVNHEVDFLSRKFESGEVGQKNEGNEQYKTVLRALLDYVKGGSARSYDTARAFGVDMELMAKGIIPRRVLQQRCGAQPAFKKSRVPYGRAFDDAVKQVMENGYIQQLGRAELMQMGKRQNAKYFAIVEPESLRNFRF